MVCKNGVKNNVHYKWRLSPFVMYIIFNTKKRQLYVTELSLRCWLCRNRLDTRERTERGLGDGAVDKLLVGLWEVNKLNFHRQSSTIVFINIQFSRFSLYFLISTNKTIYIYLCTNYTVQNVYMYFLVLHLEYIYDILSALL